MQHVNIKVITKSPLADKVVRGAIARLDCKRHQVAIESQQLATVGMMPDPNYQVIDVSKMSIAQAIRVYQEAKSHIGKASKYVLLKDEDSELAQTRIDREALEKSLKDLGLDVISSEVELANDIQTQYNELSIVYSGETQDV
jgi:hypothetical protein